MPEYPNSSKPTPRTMAAAKPICGPKRARKVSSEANCKIGGATYSGGAVSGTLVGSGAMGGGEGVGRRSTGGPAGGRILVGSAILDSLFKAGDRGLPEMGELSSTAGLGAAGAGPVEVSVLTAGAGGKTVAGLMGGSGLTS